MGFSALPQSSLAGNSGDVESPIERGRASSRVKEERINSYALVGNLGGDRKVKNIFFFGKEVLDKEFELTKLKWS